MNMFGFKYISVFFTTSVISQSQLRVLILVNKLNMIIFRKKRSDREPEQMFSSAAEPLTEQEKDLLVHV